MKNEYIRVFRAFTDEKRVRVLELLCKGEQCACVLLEDMNISQPTLSHHMKILCESGIVKSRPVGRWQYYSINVDGCDYGSRLLEAVAGHKLDKVIDFTSKFYHLTGGFRHLFEPQETVALPADSGCCCTSD